MLSALTYLLALQVRYFSPAYKCTSSLFRARSKAVCCTYWANRLQRFPEEAPNMFVTLNPVRPPAADKVLRRLSLAHPVFSAASVEAQAKLPVIQVCCYNYYS